MSAPKPATLPWPSPVPDVFAAVLQVVQDGKYELDALSNEVHELIATSGKTALSFGHVYVVGVVGADGGSVVQLTTDGRPGAPTALLDGRKNKKAGEKLLEAVRAQLASGAPATPSPVESFAVLQDGTRVPWTGGEYPGA